MKSFNYKKSKIQKLVSCDEINDLEINEKLDDSDAAIDSEDDYLNVSMRVYKISELLLLSCEL